MRAVQMTAVGGPEVLRLVELPEPQIAGERDVKVRLRAAGINPADYKQRSHGTAGGSLPVVLGARAGGGALRRRRVSCQQRRGLPESGSGSEDVGPAVG
jgi:Zn-dependent alcohol dehydrogenase